MTRARSQSTPSRFLPAIVVAAGLLGAYWLAKDPTRSRDRIIEAARDAARADSVAISTMRQLLRSQDAYRTAHPERGFARSIEELVAAGGLDSLPSEIRFTLSATSDADGIVRRYELRAANDDTTHLRVALFADETTIIRSAGGEPSADSSSDPIHYPVQDGIIGFSPDSRLLAVLAGVRVHLVDPATGATVRAITTASDGLAYAVASDSTLRTVPPANPDSSVSPDGRHALVRTGTDVRLYDIATGTELRTLVHGGDRRRVYAMDWSDDGRTIATAGEDRTLRLHDVATGRALRTLPIATTYPRMRIAPGSESVQVHSGDSIEAFALADGARLPTVASSNDRWVRPRQLARDSVFSLDERRVAIGSRLGTIAIVDLPSGAQRTTITDAKPVYPVSLSRTGRWLVARETPGCCRFRVFDAESGRPVGGVTALATADAVPAHASPDGRTLAINGPQPVLTTWDLRTGKPVRTLPTSLKGRAFGPAALLFATDDVTPVIVDARTGVRLAALDRVAFARSHGTSALDQLTAAFSPDGRLLATSGGGQRVALWDVRSGSLITTWSAQR